MGFLKQQFLHWAMLPITLVAFVLLITVVDLEPQVESDFFFSTEDPQLQASTRIAELFPSSPQILISATGPGLDSPEYLENLRHLSQELSALAKVTGVQSLTQGPASPDVVADSPIWSRLLLTSNPNSSQLIVSLDDQHGRQVILDLEKVLERQHLPSFALEMSGVPYVVELIRRHLSRDLRVFSAAALVIFGLLIALIYRSWRVVLGTLLSSLGACAITLVLLHFLDRPIGLLTANLITIVFVLTLSHIVFLTANWRQARQTADFTAAEAVSRAVKITFEASFWCMITTLLGFASLLFASAKPLRELGFSGALGAAVAILVAYGLYPAFLGHGTPSARGNGSRLFPVRPSKYWILSAATVTLVAALGLPKINTDPNLLSYFSPNSEIRPGLERIDRNGGSSPLLIVVKSPEDQPLDTDVAQEKLKSLQDAYDQDPTIGVSLSIPLLLAEAKKAPLAFLMPWSQLINLLDSPAFNHIASSFINQERTSALFFLRMREADRSEPRRNTIERLQQMVAERGLEVELVGGLFELQSQLGQLVARSLIVGLASLMTLFLIIAAIVTRSPRLTLAMVLSLVTVPVIVLGTLGHLGFPMDIISSPAANVAIALGIDSMIHLVMAVRRRKRQDSIVDTRDHWDAARDELWQPITGAMLILATGFGIFALSSFPPTARFGMAVALGTLCAAFMTLVVLPWLARGESRAQSATAKS